MKRILLVDDTSVNRYVLKRMLEIVSKEYVIDEVDNGRQSIDKHHELSYDVIFMDVVMPVMDGVEATKIIRTFDKNVIIIGLTGQVERKNEFINEGMDRVMSKPLSLKDLRLLMEKL